MDELNELTARDLVDDLMRCWRELEKNRWQLPPPNHSVRYYRCKRVAVLTDVLGIGTIADLVDGKFVERRPAAAYGPVIRAMLSHYDMPIDEGRANSTFGLSFSYQHFLNYRSKAQELFRTHEGVLEASGLFGAAFEATAKLSNQLASDLVLIEDWLARIIDPEQRSFRKRDLIEHHGYPNVDLDELRIQELWG